VAQAEAKVAAQEATGMVAMGDQRAAAKSVAAKEAVATSKAAAMWAAAPWAAAPWAAARAAVAWVVTMRAAVSTAVAAEEVQSRAVATRAAVSRPVAATWAAEVALVVKSVVRAAVMVAGEGPGKLDRHRHKPVGRHAPAAQSAGLYAQRVHHVGTGGRASGHMTTPARHRYT
jgi:hypothetical protein